jgi:hypothetical protein
MMARTMRGNLTGRAAAEYRHEVLEMLEADRQRQVQEMKLDWGDLMNELKGLDPEGWERWYEAHVPNWLGWEHSGPAMELVKARVQELRDHESTIAHAEVTV